MKYKIGGGHDEPELPAGKNSYRLNVKEKDGTVVVQQMVAPSADDAIGMVMEKMLGVAADDPAYDPMAFWDEYSIASVVQECQGGKAQTDDTDGLALA